MPSPPWAALVEVHRGEHAVGEPVEVARDVEELGLGDVRRVHEHVAALFVALARVLLHHPADDAALRVEHREAGADLVGEREQIELDAELAMVAPFGFFDAMQVLVERLLRLPCGAVDALEHRALFVAPPVRARDLRQLERTELAGRRHVRPAAQVGERDITVDDIAVDRHAAVAAGFARVLVVGVAAAHLLDDLDLVRLVREQLRARRRTRGLRATNSWSAFTILRISASILARSSSWKVAPFGRSKS